MSAAVFVAGFGVSRASGRAGSRALLTAGMWISVPAMISLAVWHSGVLQIVLAEIVIGAGIGLCFSAMGALVVDAVPPDQTGVASGMNANIRTLGGALSLAIVASIFAAHTPHGATYPTGSGYTLSFAAVAAMTGLVALATLLVPRLPRRRDKHSGPHRSSPAHSPDAIVLRNLVPSNNGSCWFSIIVLRVCEET
jgi:MFS family permease